MGFIQNIRVSTRLSLLLAVYVFAISGLGIYFIGTMENIGTEIDDIAEKDLPLIRVVTNLEFVHVAFVHHLDSILIGEASNTAYSSSDKDFDTLSMRADELLREGSNIVKSEMLDDNRVSVLSELQSVARKLELIEQSHSGFRSIVQEVIEVVRSNDEVSIPLLIERVEIKEVELNNQIKALLLELESHTQNAANLVNEHERQGVQVVMWGVAGTLIFGMLFGVLVIRSITMPLVALKQRFFEMNSSGDFSLRGDILSRDEIGEMSSSLDKLLDTLESDLLKLRVATTSGDFSFDVVAKSDKDVFATSLISLQNVYADIIEQAKTIAAGDFESSRIALRSDDDQLGKALLDMTGNLKELSKAIRAISVQDFSHRIEAKSNDDVLSLAVNKLAENLENLTNESELSSWFKSGQNELSIVLQGDPSMEELSVAAVHFFASYLDAQLAAIYVADEAGQHLELTASYAFEKQHGSLAINVGEGLVGQAALERTMISVTDVPGDYFVINSALGKNKPGSVLIIPFVYNQQLIGVVELATLNTFPERVVDFLKASMESLAIAFNSAQARTKMKELLDETSQQAYVLKEQQEELRASNEELEESAEALRAQSEETQQANIEVEEAKEAIEIKAAELEKASKYKSEFLANMSHELRTPLNSILLLARQLSANRDSNLTGKQVRSSEIIYNSGKDLLALINEILDLSKIESGKMRIDINHVSFSDISYGITQNFQHIVEEKGLNFGVKVDAGLPDTICTDQMRIDQIIKNLVSNAIKFTSQGGVTVNIRMVNDDDGPIAKTLGEGKGIAISVTDTGIGISTEDQKRVFHAFQQADGGIDRRFGGTGLGLSISRELAKILGGDIGLKSEPDKGSTFTLYLPLEVQIDETDIPPLSSVSHIARPKVSRRTVAPATIAKPETSAGLKHIPVPFEDDRKEISADDKPILIIEDDSGFAQIVQDMCRAKGFKSLVALTGGEGLDLASQYQPNAIMLDINLPDMSGINVLNHLKDNLDTRHIPVQVMSIDDETFDAFDKGAIGYLMKPVDELELEQAIMRIGEVVDKDVKDLLVIEDNDVQRSCIIELIGDVDILAKGVSTGEDALNELNSKAYDCVILDLGLPDMTGFEFLKRLKDEMGRKAPPVIVYTGRELTREENMELRSYSDSIVIKGVHSQERLLNEAMLFLHRMVSKLPEQTQTKIASLYNDDVAFKDIRVLLVDDDMRNLYALSGILEEKGMLITKAETGKQALDALKNDDRFSMVLMDIMMPEMDGYEAIQEIRKIEKFKKLPIIALTAKAMQEDKDKCFEVGANDYLSKPIEAERLLSLMRVWIKSEIIGH
ncbi:response regulator [Pseudomonadota bacterium]